MQLKTPTAYALAIVTVIVWSTTFVSTKVLLGRFTPVEILFYRFFLAWLALLVAHPKIRRPKSLRTELAFALAGFFGGSLYFLCENYALSFSLASSVSLLVSTAPLLTIFAVAAFLPGERDTAGGTARTLAGSLIALSGVALVIFNGKFVLGLNPAGDALALVAASSWALYTVVVRRIGTAHHPLFVTRKIFFYTLVTMSPALFLRPVRLDLALILEPAIAANILFLSVIASGAAYVTWNAAIHALGATKANNIIYLIPALTLFFSALILGEPVTPFALAGAALTIAGVWIASSRRGKGGPVDAGKGEASRVGADR